MITIKMEGSDH